MNETIKTLRSSTLFRDIKEEEMDAIMECLSVSEKRYRKNDIIVMAGNRVSSVGVMIDGKAQITRDDAEGNRAILSELIKPDLFLEAYVAANVKEVPVTVTAITDCKVVWIPFQKLVSSCSMACAFHNSLIKNMMQVIAQKNVAMNEKMRILACKTTREKLLTYLSDYAERVGKDQFKIPFSRSELADYLSVDRSAMSRELGKLRDEGYLNFHKNEFELL